MYWYIKYKIPSVYAQTYGGKYFIEDFKWASSHLLPTHPKLFITAWHIHVAAKWQILITQSFQRFSVLFQDATLNWYWYETTSNWERKSLLCLWIRFQPCYICFLELNKKNETKKLKTNCIQTNNWQYDFFTSKEQLRESCKRYRNHVKSSDVFNVKDRVEILKLE